MHTITTPQTEVKRLDNIAKCVAGRYARRVWWADKADLVQHAHVAIAEARQTFDPSVGRSFPTYAFQACVFALRKQLVKESSPVSGGTNGQNMARRAGLTRTGDDGLEYDNPELTSYAPSKTAEDLLLAHARASAIRSELAGICAKHSIPTQAVAVLLEDTTLQQAADNVGADQATMLSHCRKLKSLALFSKTLHAEWKKQG